MTVAAAKPVLIIGGTGFIGSHLVEHYTAAGNTVRVASRRGAWPWGEPVPGASFCSLDLTGANAAADLDQSLDQVRQIINISGALLRPGVSADHYRRLHVGGTEALLEALHRSGGNRRLVHVSTTGVLGPTGPAPLDETSPPRPSTIYEKTKAEGEALALAAAGQTLEVVVARPGLVYGPRDLHLLGLFRAIAAGTFRLIAGGRACWQPVAAADVAEGLAALATAPGAGGGIFHLAGRTPVTLAAFTQAIADALGTHVRGPSLPRPLAWLAGAALEGVCLPLGLEPPLSRMRVRTLTEDRRYAIQRAREVAGWQPRTTLTDGLRQAVAWYRGQGLLAEQA